MGAYWIALFHLMTHAFFKSLLFLGAGNVMHAMHDELNIKKMGGLFKSMKVTAILMILASIALAGIYPFAGFFSKDKILEVAFNEGAFMLWLALLVGAGLTAFYGFRLIMLVFFGKERHSEHPHEAYTYMLVAMTPLCILAVFAGFYEHSFMEYVYGVLPEYVMDIDKSTAFILIAGTMCVALAGILFAIWAYTKEIFKPSIEQTFIYKLFSNQYYIPQLYKDAIMKPFTALSVFAWQSIDKKVVDATVDAIAKSVESFGEGANKMQTGNLSIMLRWMVGGFVILLLLALCYRF